MTGVLYFVGFALGNAAGYMFANARHHAIKARMFYRLAALDHHADAGEMIAALQAAEDETGLLSWFWRPPNPWVAE